MSAKTIILAAILTLLPTMALSQTICGKRADLVNAAVNKYNEAQTAIAILDNNNVVEIFVSPEGTFTFMVSKPDASMTCVTATGHSWRQARIKEEKSPSPTKPKFSD